LYKRFELINGAKFHITIPKSFEKRCWYSSECIRGFVI